MNVLVSGASGSLGRQLLDSCARRGFSVRATTRRQSSSSAADGIEWMRADLETGEGLDTAVQGVDVAIHAASDPKRSAVVDVEGTRRLVDAALAARVRHFIYVSIVGIDRIPYPYYQHKLAAEGIVQASSIPQSIIRATQFHSFVDKLLQGFARVPGLLLLPRGFAFQPVAESEVAARIVKMIEAGPSGRITNFGGPDVIPLAQLADSWMAARGERRLKIGLPVTGAMARAMRAHANTDASAEHGTVRWNEWLDGVAPSLVQLQR